MQLISDFAAVEWLRKSDARTRLTMSSGHESAVEQSLRKICAEVAGKSRVDAACQCGEKIYSTSSEGYDLFIIMEDYLDGLRYHTRKLNAKPVTVLAADRSLVYLDARKGAVGDFIIERLLTPYRPVENEGLLRSIEVDAKERVLHEELRELILEYGEMARELSIQEEYLILARIRRRARAFLPFARAFALLLEPSVRNTNLKNMAPGYQGAIERLVEEGILRREGSNYILGDSFVDRVLTGKSASKVINVVQAGRRALQSYLAHGRAAYLTPDVLTRELAASLEQGLFADVETGGLEDPKRHLFLRTATGQVSLADRFSIETFAAKFRPGVVVTVSPLGNVLNEVYLITAGKERLVAKKFTEWHGFKWFTLDLVSLGTRFFSVSGKVRLENEYAINRLLLKRGVRVPEILHISVPDRVLVERYIEGSSMVELVKEAVGTRSMSDRSLSVASKVGSTLARIHALGVSMGDSKPENFRRATFDDVYVLDLEQAGKSGDRSWDVAEYLYFSGHYVFPTIPSGGFREYVNAFIQGYLEQGDENVIKRAAGVRYGRVFSLWTPPLAMHEVSKALRGSA